MIRSDLFSRVAIVAGISVAQFFSVTAFAQQDKVESKQTSPTTGTKGTSGMGQGSADPTYGGTTGTTVDTASPNQPAPSATPTKPRRKPRATKKKEAADEAPKTGALNSIEETEDVDRSLASIEVSRDSAQQASTSGTGGFARGSDSEAVTVQRRPGIMQDPAVDLRASESSATRANDTALALGPDSGSNIDWKKDNPARTVDPLMSLEPYSRQPTQIGSVQITGKDKSVAVLEGTSTFADPNAIARNENTRVATQPIAEVNLDRYSYRGRHQMRSAMMSRLDNLDQRIDVLRAQARADLGQPRPDLLRRIASFEGQHAALEQKVDFMAAVGDDQWGSFKGQFRDSLAQLETQMAQVSVGFR